ncbi:MAG: hypothetical protein ACRBC3_20550 [Burkholderiaceae bacterium]
MSIISTTQWVVSVSVVATLAACGGGGEVIDDGGTGGGGAGSTGEANIALRSLTYTDSGNWQYKVETQTAVDATADSNGNFARVEQVTRSVSGSPQTWRFGNTPEQADDLYWNGSQWRSCPDGYRTTLGPVNSSGSRQFNHCDMYSTGVESVIRTDVSDLTMQSVLADIRTLPGADELIDFADYGPSNLAVLGSTRFPAGSYKEEVIRTIDTYAPRYSDTTANSLRAYNADIAAGGDARSAPIPACGMLTNSTQPDDISFVATNLEQIIGSARGTPCIFNQFSNSNGTSVNPTEWWTPTSVEYGILADRQLRTGESGSFYESFASMRLAFTGGTQVTYYECLVTNPPPGQTASVRDCLTLGTGNYAIETYGDARVMFFNNTPTRFNGLSADRVLIERGGRVAEGIRERTGVQDNVGFNDEASTALLQQLLIPVPVPQ